MKPLPIVAMIAVTAGGTLHVQAQPAQAEGAAVIASAPGRAEAARTITLGATVTAIDKASRTVTLKGPQGNEVQVVAGPEVRNFAQIHVGSVVELSYVEALALELKKGASGAPARSASDAMVRAPAGDRSGGAVGQGVTVTADVTAVDAATQTVTLKGPKRTVQLHVPDAGQFKNIAVGDKVQATYAEAMAINIEPAARK